jgi:hypothetical protein
MTSPMPAAGLSDEHVERALRMSFFGRSQVKKRRSFVNYVLRMPQLTRGDGFDPYNERRRFLCRALQEAKGGTLLAC